MSNCSLPAPKRGNWLTSCALRISLQELPQHTLELEFAQRVLNRAERELNAERIALVAAEGDLTEESSVAKVPVIAPTAVDRALSDGRTENAGNRGVV